MPTRPSRPYSIEFSSRAWRQVGTLSQPVFSKLQQAVASLAEAVGNPLRTPPPGLLRRAGEQCHAASVAVGELVVLYEVDDARQRVLVVQLADPSAGGPPSGSAR